MGQPDIGPMGWLIAGENLVFGTNLLLFAPPFGKLTARSFKLKLYLGLTKITSIVPVQLFLPKNSNSETGFIYMTAEFVLRGIIVNWLFYHILRMTNEFRVLRSHQFTFFVH